MKPVSAECSVAPLAARAMDSKDARLDFYSPHFDAAAALADASLRAPLNVKALASMRDCRFLLPPSHEEYLSRAQEEARQRERAQRERDQAFRYVAPAPVAAQEGPGFLASLACDAKGTIMESWSSGRVVVHLRDAVKLKSTVEGTLLASDKHFNLLLKVHVAAAALRKAVGSPTHSRAGCSGDDCFESPAATAIDDDQRRLCHSPCTRAAMTTRATCARTVHTRNHAVGLSNVHK